ncbi:DNA repair protein RecO [Desulforhopalus vacuolatus]|uniref:DNA repair protein RecO n=1 Tax=Desulforhopalus vacuolatus TaxID=40414 RepID=UPI00196506CF|nr:DNA repair protein RecO [Desulforhopalus vacuolatus]MBM9519924.1 DNA repair protein RecO [Desulforhopalus vacuolatus]
MHKCSRITFDNHRMEDDAIVLNSLETGESDLIVTLFCHNSGRISAIAKGARNSKKRFVNKLEIFTRLHVTFKQKVSTSLAFLNEAELNNIYPFLRTNYPAYLAGNVIRELLLHSIRDAESDSDLFRLTLWAFYQLDMRMAPRTVVALFFLRSFDLLGYRPELRFCTSCGAPASSHPVRFDMHSGGLICEICNGKPLRSPLSGGSLNMLNMAQSMSLEHLDRLKPGSRVSNESLRLLYSFAQHILQRDINSWSVFSAVMFKFP